MSTGNFEFITQRNISAGTTKHPGISAGLRKLGGIISIINRTIHFLWKSVHKLANVKIISTSANLQNYYKSSNWDYKV